MIIGLFLVSATFAVHPLFAQEQSMNDADIEAQVREQANQDSDVIEMQKNIAEKEASIQDLLKKINVYENNIEEKQGEQLTLKSQITLLEDNIEKTRTSIEKLEKELETTQLAITVTERNIHAAENDIAEQQSVLGKTFREMYIAEQKTSLEIQLGNKTFAEFFSALEYNNRLREKISSALDRIRENKKKLEDEQASLNQKKEKLRDQKDELSSTAQTLTGEETYKNQLLDDTEESEEKFQKLVDAVKQEQAGVEADIGAMERAVSERVEAIRTDVQKKIESQTSTETAVGDKSVTAIAPTEEEIAFATGDIAFMWPIASRTITCGFHCAGYPFRRYFEHSGTDIATPYGTSIVAAESGYVAIAKSDGTASYAYVMIVHGDGYSTVYGHLSAVDVSVDQYVKRGQVIGKSGGLPGTPGAGSYSTGAHLHFEIRVDGIPVNAMSYLP